MNYSMGDVMLVFRPEQRDGQQVLSLYVFRESRPEDTRECINLLPVPQPGAQGE